MINLYTFFNVHIYPIVESTNLLMQFNVKIHSKIDFAYLNLNQV